MKHLLFIISFIVIHINAFAQCKQKWLRYNGNKRDTIITDQSLNKSTLIDISGKKIRKVFLDSVITFLEATENRKKSNNAMYSDNRIFHHGFTEVILRNVTSNSPDSSAIKLYNFSLSEGYNGNDWDPDLYYFFTYTKKYGVVYKNHWDKDMNPELYFKEILLEDNCIKDKSFMQDRASIFHLLYP